MGGVLGGGSGRYWMRGWKGTGRLRTRDGACMGQGRQWSCRAAVSWCLAGHTDALTQPLQPPLINARAPRTPPHPSTHRALPAGPRYFQDRRGMVMGRLRQPQPVGRPHLVPVPRLPRLHGHALFHGHLPQQVPARWVFGLYIFSLAGDGVWQVGSLLHKEEGSLDG